MVAWIVQQLQEAGLSPAILTRGYKAVDGRSDEAELLRELTGVNVVVNPDRVAGATTAIAGGANVLVMDDGFQHQRLRRDLNIVLVDATLPWGYGCCLPRGLLREPKSALKDAHVVVITRADEVPPERLSDLREEVARYAPGASLHEARHRPVGIIDEQGRSRSLSELAGRMACAFCGLGNPQPFFATLEQLHVRLVSRTALNDHAAYDRPLTTTVCGECGMEGCEAQLLLTTQKDYVKIRQAESRRPVWQLQMQLELSGDATALLELLSGRPR
jgi:tetraacyldisaccharide 4'-kinase